MLADAHREAAEDIEASVQVLRSVPKAGRMIIEGSWGAAFHWIAYGCQTKHKRHQESHSRLGAFVRQQGESAVAGWWEELDNCRRGGWYGHADESEEVQVALDLLQQIRSWATS